MERMDCMEYMDQVVGNIFGNISKGFQKRNLKTDVTFKKIDVALVFFCCRRVDDRKVGNGGVKNIVSLLCRRNCARKVSPFVVCSRKMCYNQ